MANYDYIEVAFKDDETMEALESIAFSEFSCTGTQDFSVDEPKVDQILGERSYSGGDLPIEVIDEVVDTLRREGGQKKRFYFSDETSAKAFFQRCEDLDLEAELLSEEIKDWNESWKKSFSAINVTEEFAIIPSWEKVQDNPNEIYIYPGMGFGTGSHETTFLCMKIMLEVLEKANLETCLDFGCGSGILGIGFGLKAEKSRKIDYLDIDREALDNCEVNLELNPKADLSTGHLLLSEEKDKLEDSYDLVFANILLDALIQEKETILSKTAKYLIVSGLLAGQEKEVREAYEKHRPDLKLKRVETKNEWVAALFEVDK